MPPSAAAVLVAAGRGARFGADRPKQFLPLAGKPLLYWSLRALSACPAVGAVILVTAADRRAWAERFVRRERLRKVRAVVEGGLERADSVRRGVAATPASADVVLVHDAARPGLTPEVVGRVIAAARRRGAALAAWPVPDTLKRARASSGHPLVRRTEPRAGLWLAQTPQAFRRDVAARVFRGPARSVTDDVQLAERLGVPVELVPGDPRLFKVTWPEDYALAKSLFARSLR